MNHVSLSGYLARDPEAKYFESGTCVVSCALGVQEYQKNLDKRNFVEIKVWGKTGETLANYCQKGSYVVISGRLDVETWENKEGKKQSKTVVVVDRLDLPPKPKSGNGGNAPEDTPF